MARVAREAQAIRQAAGVDDPLPIAIHVEAALGVVLPDDWITIERLGSISALQQTLVEMLETD